MKTIADQTGVAVIGMGYVGLSIAAVLAGRGARVWGIDCMQEIVDQVNEGRCPVAEPGMAELVRQAAASGRLAACSEYSVIKGCGVIIVSVGTPLNDCLQPDTSQLMKALDGMAPYLRRGQLVIMKSTVPPGMTRKAAAYLAGKTGLEPGWDFHMACCPERLAEGNMIRDIESIPVVVGGLTSEDTGLAASFWTALGWSVIKVSRPEEAEMCKLADNQWIDLNIALANELCMVCHRMKIDILEVINASNTLPKGMSRVNLLFPGPGVGGSCLVKDPWFLQQLGKENGVNITLPETGRKINDSMPGFIFDVLKEGLKEHGVPLEEAQITIMGLAFKHKTGDTRYTPTLPLAKKIAAAGAGVRVYDPWVGVDEAGKLLAGTADFYVDLRDSLAGSNAVVFMVGHPEFLKQPAYWKGLLENNCLILDCRYIFSPAQMMAAGFKYIAPGRGMPSDACGDGTLYRESGQKINFGQG